MELPDGLRHRFEVKEVLSNNPPVLTSKAMEKSSGRTVVLKTLDTDETGNRDQKRFLREVETLRGFDHPDVVRLIDGGREGPLLWLCMERIEGTPLAEIIDNGGPLPLDVVLPIAEGLLAGLGALHDAGIVHRDVTPANVIVDPDGRGKVVDLGIAAPRIDGGTSDDPALTRTGIIVGTPGYVAPERILGEGCDHRADLYAVGIVLYECLTGGHPFGDADLWELLHLHVEIRPHKVSTRVPELPAAVDAAIARALEKVPEDRFESAASFWEALREGLAGKERPLEKTVALDDRPKSPESKLRNIAARGKVTPTPEIPGFLLDRILGKGGMGIVYLATQKSLGRKCAVKVLLPNLGIETAAKQRMGREARVLGAVSHPNVVRIYEHGEVGARIWFAMEYVDGRSLGEILDEEGALEPERALTVGLQILDALDCVHEAGLVHRDLKPDNILTTVEGVIKVGDFGLVGGQELTRVTLASSWVGTARYLPPEIVTGERQSDARSDLYQWALIMWELLCGRPLYDGETISEIIQAIRRAQVPALEAPLGKVPGRLERVLRRCLELEPDKRPASVDEVTRLLGPKPDRSRRSDSLGVVGEEDSSTGEVPRRRRPTGGRLQTPVVFALVALGLVVLALFLRFGGRTLSLGPIETMPDRLEVEGLAAPGARVNYTLTVGKAAATTGIVRAGDDGRFRLSVSGLPEGQTGRLRIEVPGGPVEEIPLKTPLLGFSEGPWARTGPGWIELWGQLTHPVEIHARATLVGGDRPWETRRPIRKRRSFSLRIGGVPTIFRPDSRMDLRLRHRGRILARGRLRPEGARRLLTVETASTVGPEVDLMPCPIIVGNELVVADSMGLVHGIDLERAALLSSEQGAGVAWTFDTFETDRRTRPQTHVALGPTDDRIAVAVWGQPAKLFLLRPRARRRARGGQGGLSQGEEAILLPIDGSPRAIASLPGGRLVVAVYDGTKTQLVSVEAGRGRILSSFEGAVAHSFTRCGNVLVASCGKAGKGLYHFVDLLTGRVLRSIPLTDVAHTAPRSAPDGLHVYASNDQILARFVARPREGGAAELRPKLGEWSLPARGVQGPPVFARGRCWVLRKTIVKRSTLHRARPVLCSFTASKPLQTWKEHPLPVAHIPPPYTAVQAGYRLVNGFRFVFSFGERLSCVRLDGLRLEWTIPAPFEPRFPFLDRGGSLYVLCNEEKELWEVSVRPRSIEGK